MNRGMKAIGLLLAVVQLQACSRSATTRGAASPEEFERSAPTLTSDAVSYPSDRIVFEIERQGSTYAYFQQQFASFSGFALSGDGRMFSQYRGSMEASGPRPSGFMYERIAPESVTKILKLAETRGLLRPAPNYRLGIPPEGSTEETVLTFYKDGKPVVHRVQALGEFEEIDPARKLLNEYVQEVRRLLTPVNEEPVPYFATSYLLAAQKVEIDPADWTAPSTDPNPAGSTTSTLASAAKQSHPDARFLPWPSNSRLEIASLKCVVVSAQEIDDLFGRINELTFFTSEGAVFAVAYRPLLPGEKSCDAMKEMTHR
jgi:hypothetical protein